MKVRNVLRRDYTPPEISRAARPVHPEPPLVLLVAHELDGGVGDDPGHGGAVPPPQAQRPLRPVWRRTTFGQMALAARAGHFRYFFDILHFFQVNNLILYQSYSKCPLPVKLT